jgi:hypothetical protein
VNQIPDNPFRKTIPTATYVMEAPIMVAERDRVVKRMGSFLFATRNPARPRARFLSRKPSTSIPATYTERNTHKMVWNSSIQTPIVNLL